jgi:hypothetical protein
VLRVAPQKSGVLGDGIVELLKVHRAKIRVASANGKKRLLDKPKEQPQCFYASVVERETSSNIFSFLEFKSKKIAYFLDSNRKNHIFAIQK